MAEGAEASSRPSVDLLVGRSIGHFRIDSVLGLGGMGAVYRAWDLSLERPVALKTVLFDSQQTRMLFVREARAQAKLRHANVVPVHFIGEHDGLTYLVMELVDGESLATKLERDGRLPEARALEIVDAVAAALESAHGHGLVHRDVKPSNVLVETAGRVLLADFGLAKVVGAVVPAADESGGAARGPAVSGVVTHTKGAIGTPAYIAPELTAGGATTIDHRADIYSLGVTLYEIVTGTRPFGGPTNSRLAAAHERAPVIAPRIIVPGLSPSVEALILRMLEKSPADRFPTYAELRRAIADIRAQRIPAPFLSRVGAFTIDFLPFMIVESVIEKVTHSNSTGPFVWLTTALVYGVLEARSGATWGKKILSIRTITELGLRPPPFSRAFVRSLLKLWGPLTVAIVHIALVGGGSHAVRIGAGANTMAATTDSSIAMVCAIVWILSAFIALGRRRLTLHDRVAHTRVIVDLG